MCKTTYTCDRCGKELIEDERGFFKNGYVDVNIEFDNTPYSIGEFDICSECAEELFKMVEDYLKGGAKNETT